MNHKGSGKERTVGSFGSIATASWIAAMAPGRLLLYGGINCVSIVVSAILVMQMAIMILIMIICNKYEKKKIQIVKLPSFNIKRLLHTIAVMIASCMCAPVCFGSTASTCARISLALSMLPMSISTYKDYHHYQQQHQRIIIIINQSSSSSL